MNKKILFLLFFIISCERDSPFEAYSIKKNYTFSSPLSTFLGKDFFRIETKYFYHNWSFYSLPYAGKLDKDLDISTLPIRSLGEFKIREKKSLPLKSDYDLYYFCLLDDLSASQKSPLTGKHLIYFRTGDKNLIEIFLDQQLLESRLGFLIINSELLKGAKELKIRTSKGESPFNRGLITAVAFKENYKISSNKKKWLSPTTKNLDKMITNSKKKVYQKRTFPYRQRKDRELAIFFRENIRELELNGKKLHLKDEFIPKSFLKKENEFIYSNLAYHTGLEPESQISLKEYQVSLIQKSLYSKGDYYKIAIYLEEEFLTWASPYLAQHYAYKFFPKGWHRFTFKIYSAFPDASVNKLNFSPKFSPYLLGMNPQRDFLFSSLSLEVPSLLNKTFHYSFILGEKEKEQEVYLNFYSFFMPFYIKELIFPKLRINGFLLENPFAQLPKEKLLLGVNRLSLEFEKKSSTPFPFFSISFKKAKTPKKFKILDKKEFLPVSSLSRTSKQRTEDEDILAFRVFLYKKGIISNQTDKELKKLPLYQEFKK